MGGSTVYHLVTFVGFVNGHIMCKCVNQRVSTLSM